MIVRQKMDVKKATSREINENIERWEGAAASRERRLSVFNLKEKQHLQDYENAPGSES